MEAQIIMPNLARHPAETCSCPADLASAVEFQNLLTAFFGAHMAAVAHIAAAQSSLVSDGFPHPAGEAMPASLAAKEKQMSIGSIGGAASLNPLYAASQAQACQAMPVDGTTGAAASGSNALTGSTTASLDSQTLQALLGLTQQDTSSSNQDQGGTASQTDQTQGATPHHHHHHHHGDGGAQSSTDSSSSSSSSPATQGLASNTDAFGVADADSSDGSTDSSLTSALLSA
jgi:hypothetical protein